MDQTGTDVGSQLQQYISKLEESIEKLDWKKQSSTVDESERSPEKGNTSKRDEVVTSKNTGNPSRHHQFQILDSPKTILDVDYDLLKSGIAILPGSRDLDGRSVVFIFTNGQFWKNQLVSSMELARLLMYYKTVPREEVQRRGLTIIAIIKGASPSTVNTLLQTFMVFEDNCPDTLSAVHLLTDRHVEPLVLNSPVYDPSCSYQLNLLLNTDMLLQYMSYDQLPPVLDGHFPHHHEEWIRFHMQLDPFVAKLHTMANYLLYVIQGICDIETIPSTAEELSQLVLHHDNILKSLFQDERFISIRSEGEGVMKCLKREEVQIGHTEDYRDAMLYVTKLHDQVESTLVKLSRLADKRLAKLESILQLKEFKEECEKIITWTRTHGEESLLKHAHLADNLKSIKTQQKEFEKFYFSAMTHIDKGNDLLEEASMLAQSGNFNELADFKEMTFGLKKHLHMFTSRLEETRERLESTTKCYHLLDKTYEWALEAMKYVASMKMEHCGTPEGLEKLLRSLELYLRDHPVMKEETFISMIGLARKLQNDRLIEQCSLAKSRCEETQKLLILRQTTLRRAREQMIHEQGVQCFSPKHRTTDFVKHDRDITSVSSSSLCSDVVIDRSVVKPRSYSTPEGMECSPQRRSVDSPKPVVRTSNTHHLEQYGLDKTPQNKTGLYGIDDENSVRTDDRSGDRTYARSDVVIGDRTEIRIGDLSIQTSSSLPKQLTDTKLTSEQSKFDFNDRLSLPEGSPLHYIQNRHGKKSLHRATTAPNLPLPSGDAIPKEEDQTCDKNVSPSRKNKDGRTNSMITGSTDSLPSLPEELEEGDDQRPTSPQLTSTPVPVNTHLSIQNRTIPDDSLPDVKLNGTDKSRRTLAHIMREMIQTERDYVYSLQYIIDHFIPELQRQDVPQALRGKSNVIFGNIEKIYQFHRQYFLTEVEMCERSPFQIAHYFIMHESQFYLYALYNKNKPRSDNLMAEYGKYFFRDKQLRLGDKMDLSSYLLKPVQRMGKYALLLKQMMKECPRSQQEYQDLKAAEQMVRFQLRHGNDLLAMDSLRECDVNLQEQGRLIRQDEFLVWQGRKKSMRHLFLFEDLVLFSKTYRGRNGGSDTYVYKYSLKMSDIGLTADYGESGYKFELWFRKRSIGENYVLQAPSSEVKSVWVKEISQLLWNQAMKNKEHRLTEMATMGIGNKPSLDIQPSADNIQDRFVNVNIGNRGARTRNSIAVSSLEHYKDNYKRPHSIISVSSSNSSSNSSHSGVQGHRNLSSSHDASRFYGKSGATFLSNESGIGTDVSSGPEMDMSGRNVRHSPSRSVNRTAIDLFNSSRNSNYITEV